ncbi:enzyme binding [Homalodisca vitripennis]|nr:enzyme binding [Homalodisca vitripennis]
MTTAGEEKLGHGMLHSPESDCNSNNLDSTASYLSNTSSQDVDFIQDNSDYQWFLDYGTCIHYKSHRPRHHSLLGLLFVSLQEGSCLHKPTEGQQYQTIGWATLSQGYVSDHFPNGVR